MSPLNPKVVSKIAKHLTEELLANGSLMRKDAVRWIEANHGISYTSADCGLAPEVAKAFKNLRGPSVKWNGWLQRWEDR